MGESGEADFTVAPVLSAMRGRESSIGPSLIVMRPLDPVSISEAAWILGCSRSTIQRMIHDGRLPAGDAYSRGRLSKADVEKVSSMVYPWRRHLHDPWSYWVTGQDAADVLGIGQKRLERLALANRVPYVRHRDGTRLYRRNQLQRMARHGPGVVATPGSTGLMARTRS